MPFPISNDISRVPTQENFPQKGKISSMRMRCKEMSIDISLQHMRILEISPFRGKFFWAAI